MPGDDGGFAGKLRRLIETVHPAERSGYSYREIASAIEARGGPAISAAYIQQLATGRRINPKIHYVEALARFFGVPAAYFFDDEVTNRVHDQLDRLRAERTPETEARLMAMRAEELSPQGRRQVMDLLELVYRMERGEHPGDPDAAGD